MGCQFESKRPPRLGSRGPAAGLAPRAVSLWIAPRRPRPHPTAGRPGDDHTAGRIRVSQTSDPWALLQKCNTRLSTGSIQQAFDRDPDRGRRHTHRLGQLRLDLSRNVPDESAWSALLALAAERGLPAGIRRLLGGDTVNLSEQRPALHSALRCREVATATGVVGEVEAMQARMFELADGFAAGTWRGATGNPITDLVNIGIGGSDLGPKLAVEALAGAGPRRVHFLANVDGSAIAALLPRLNPATTAFCLTSKSFSTRESLTNATSARAWLEQGLGRGPEAPGAHFIAVTARPERARRFGIAAERILPMWDWVGGRYSLWSAVGLPIAAAIGAAGFKSLLAGAAEVDVHFRDEPLARNLPVLLALVGIWHRNVAGLLAHAVVPYDERLKSLPEYLQQLDMESNGKSVTAEGEPLQRASGPLIWGGIGTNVQHAFFQWLQQGTDVVPVDFIAVRDPGHDYPEHHRQLLANMLAQATALMRGRDATATAAVLRAEGLDPAEIDRRTLQCVFPGNRPSNVLMLEALTPRALGNLLALYEHKVFVQSWIWGNNAFDQWGVELGKTIAADIEPRLERAAGGGDPSLDHWIDWVSRRDS